MKSIASFLSTMTGTLFISQLILIELGRIFVRLPEFFWVIYACGGTFILSLIYLGIVIIVENKKKEDK